MNDDDLALFGGPPTRTQPWPEWPRAMRTTFDALADVLSSTRWAVSGPYDGRICYERRFAEAFADYHAVSYCTPTASGTAALTIALQAIGVSCGDEVLVPGLTWVACASAVVNLGAVPVLVDCDPRTLAMSPQRAREAVTSRTVAILVVHPFCTVADLDAFVALSKETGLALIEDCAQAHGARWRGKPVGTFGAAGCFSMQQAKLLTSGEGGAVITDDQQLYERLEQLRMDGRMFVSEPKIGRLELTEVGAVQGRNLCLSEFQAAVLLSGLERLADENERRSEHARQLESALADCMGVSVLPHDPRVTTRTFYNFVLRFDPAAFSGNSVDAISQALSAELGTSVNPVYVPLNRHRLLCPRTIPLGDRSEEYVARLNPAQFPLPESDRARRTCATLTHPVFLDDNNGMDDIAAAVHKVQRRAHDLLAFSQEPTLLAF